MRKLFATFAICLAGVPAIAQDLTADVEFLIRLKKLEYEIAAFTITLIIALWLSNYS